MPLAKQLLYAIAVSKSRFLQLCLGKKTLFNTFCEVAAIVLQLFFFPFKRVGPL